MNDLDLALIGNCQIAALLDRPGRRKWLDLLPKELDPATHKPWGHFPRTYSMVGTIHCATRLSRSWADAL